MLAPTSINQSPRTGSSASHPLYYPTSSLCRVLIVLDIKPARSHLYSLIAGLPIGHIFTISIIRAYSPEVTVKRINCRHFTFFS